MGIGEFLGAAPGVIQAITGLWAGNDLAGKVPKIPKAPMLGWNPKDFTGDKGQKAKVPVPEGLQRFLPQSMRGGLSPFPGPEGALKLALGDLDRLQASAQTTYDRTLGGLGDVSRTLGSLPGLASRGVEQIQGAGERSLGRLDPVQNQISSLAERARGLPAEMINPMVDEVRRGLNSIYELRNQVVMGNFALLAQNVNETTSQLAAAADGIAARVEDAKFQAMNAAADAGYSVEEQALIGSNIEKQGSSHMWDAFTGFATAQGQLVKDFAQGSMKQITDITTATQARVSELAQFTGTEITRAVLSGAELQRLSTAMSAALATEQNSIDAQTTMASLNWQIGIKAMQMEGQQWFVQASSQLAEPVALMAPAVMQVFAAFQNLASGAWSTEAQLNIANFANVAAPTQAITAGIVGGANSIGEWLSNAQAARAAESQASKDRTAGIWSAGISGISTAGGGLLGNPGLLK